jgi:hypothetical protein
MKLKNYLSVLVSFSILLIVALFSVDTASAIPNPAPVYCENMGYTSDGTNCIFDDGKSCELWAFFNGNCGQDYVKKLSCKKLGESLFPGDECCEDLTPASATMSGPEGTAIQSVGEWPVCIACGDGVCAKIDQNRYGSWENEHNCPLDCSTTACKPEGYKYWVNPFSRDFQCCEGLRHIMRFLTYFPEDGVCGFIQDWAVCSDCGNGVCESEWEHFCNCEKDCPDPDSTIAPVEIKVDTNEETNEDEGLKTTKILIDRTPSGLTSIREGVVEAVTSEKIKGIESKLYLETSEGDKQIKVLPKEAYLKTTESTNADKIEIKKESQKPVYLITRTKQAKLFLAISVSMEIKTRISAETGDIISVEKPWWSFLAK